MKKIGILVLATLPLIGCQTSGPITYSANSEPRASSNAKSCEFDKIPGKTYLIAPNFQKYVTNSFFYDPEKEKVWQLDKENYASLISQPLKIVETGVITKEDAKSRQPYLAKYRYSEDEIDGIPYIRDKAYSSKLVTKDCSVYYLSGGTIVKSLMSSIINQDGSRINEGDVLALYGDESLQKKSMNASVEYDRFEKILKISTPYYDNMLIRGAINTTTKSVTFIQLYADLTFFDKWGSISNAIDTNGVRHEVVRISTDVDCKNSDMFGCKLTETVGITIDENFLRNNQGGFEIKVSGSKDQIIKVSAQMVEGFLLGLSEAKKQAETGDFGV